MGEIGRQEWTKLGKIGAWFGAVGTLADEPRGQDRAFWAAWAPGPNVLPLLVDRLVQAVAGLPELKPFPAFFPPSVNVHDVFMNKSPSDTDSKV